MLVIEINVINTQTPQRSFAGFTYVLRPAVDPALGWIFASPDPKLCGKNHFAPSSTNGFPNQLLIRKRPIHVRSVKEIDPEFQSPMNCGNRLVFIGCAIEFGHAHAA